MIVKTYREGDTISQTYNLTHGKPAKLLLSFFFPMLFTNLLQQLYSFIDTVIVGKGLGDNALAAVGNMSSLTLFIIGFSMGMTNGFSILIAQSYGAGQYDTLRKIIASSIKLSALLSVILTVISFLLLKSILLALQTPESILAHSLRYGYIIFGGLTATIAYNLCSGILRALGDSKTPLLAIIVSSIVNIGLDCLFIFVWKTGVEGPAIATIIAQTVSAFICYWKVRKIDILHMKREDFTNDRHMYGELLKNGIPMACMNTITAVGCMVIQAYVNSLGVSYTSAYSACNKYLNLFMLPSVTAGFAVSAFTSQNYGAMQYMRIREGVRVGCAISFVSYVLLGSVMVIFPSALAGLMLNGKEPIALAAQYLRICGMMLFILNFLFIFRNAVQGMGQPFIPMCSGILEMALRIIVIYFFLPTVGFTATAYAETAAWIGALLLNVAAYWVMIH